jgi:hypothetical protein
MPARNASTRRAQSREPPASSKSNSSSNTNATSNANSKSTPRSAARPSTVTRTSSAPLAPSSDREPKFLSFDADFNVEKRGSVASVQDDPFFRHYQSPNSVSLAKELRSATYSNHFREEEEDLPDEDDLPPRSPKRPTVDNSVNLPVCVPHPYR